MWKRYKFLIPGYGFRGIGRIASACLLLILGVTLAGCYTLLRHPTVLEERSDSTGYDHASGYACTDCHNNLYDHHWDHRWSGGYGLWGGYWGGFYPYRYYPSSPWSRYYWEPWWSGWGGWYYNPPPYSPGTPAPEPPDRPQTRRALPPSPSGNPAPPPTMNPPPPTQGQQQGGQQDNNSQNQNSGERKGRRGRP
jgi:hypothetical protein